MLSIIKANNTHKESIKQCFMTLFDEGELKHFNKITNLSLSYVAIDRCEEVKGFILVVPSSKHAEYEIAFLGISSRYRGKGYAKVLLKLVLRRLEGHTIWLNTLDTNLEACALYECMGLKRGETFRTIDGTLGIIYKNYL